ncbi:aminotransferase class V-fold PLP-dependent enzyme [Mycetocola spongiae]|uniref:aminotransferase class V-fold PLP-dependent enzyme n=1 Tax=Mycetocola spongiae TaxID=2859226 RepID=UPI001CF43B8B|nr:aminotransferase class V-fold PLP-dependent enzyme [Mycetocola spongiae]UCR88996.1 aminotransferase class V-fold PLP-dependent enzyme [Mycetocola spongiae]
MSGIKKFIAGFADQEAGYLDYARMGPLSVAVREDIRVHTEALGRGRFGTMPFLAEEGPRFQSAVSALTGFAPEQVVAQPNTGTALMQAMFGLSGGLLVSAQDFPSVPLAAARSHEHVGRLTPHWLKTEDGRVTPEAVRAQLSVDIDAVVVSLVDYRTGFVADLAGIRDVIGDRLLIVDAIQGFGVVDADYAAADVLAAGGHKWARAGWGTGFLALSDLALDLMTPVISGFMGTGDVEPWGRVVEPGPGASAYAVSNPDRLAQSRFAASLEETAAAGVSSIAAVISDLAGEIIEMASEYNLPVVSPREAHRRAGIVVLEPEGDDAGLLAAALHNAGITATLREGRTRLSVHAGTDRETLRMLREAMASLCGARPQIQDLAGP